MARMPKTNFWTAKPSIATSCLSVAVMPAPPAEMLYSFSAGLAPLRGQTYSRPVFSS